MGHGWREEEATVTAHSSVTVYSTVGDTAQGWSVLLYATVCVSGRLHVTPVSCSE